MNSYAYILSAVVCGLLAVGLMITAGIIRRLRRTLQEEHRRLGAQLANNRVLQAAQERLQQAQQLAGLRTWEWDLDGNPSQWVDNAFRLLSLAGEQEGESGSLRHVHPEDKGMLKTGVAESLIKGRPLDVTFRSLQADGVVRHLRTCAQIQRNGDGRPRRILGTVLDVTEFKLAEARALHAASVDSLTGALTRRRFFELAENEFERWQRYRHPTAVMMIDVDNFKRFNDAFGHGFGDRVLHDVVTAIKSQLRRSDILGRYGGDEFAIVLPDSSLQSAWESADRLRRAVSAVRLAGSGGGGDAGVSISVGLVDIADDPDIEQVLKRADQALYAAKKSGRNRVMRG